MIKILWPWEKQVSRSNGGTKTKKQETKKEENTRDKKQKMIVMENCNEYWSKLQLEIDYAQ